MTALRVLTGAAYLPIDTSYPEHLVQMVFEDADPLAVTTSPEFAAKLEGGPS